MSDSEKVEENKEKVSADNVNLKHSSDAASSNDRMGGELGKFLYQRAGTYFDINAGRVDHALFEAVEAMLKNQ
jgi:hypothetical protein